MINLSGAFQSTRVEGNRIFKSYIDKIIFGHSFWSPRRSVNCWHCFLVIHVFFHMSPAFLEEAGGTQHGIAFSEATRLEGWLEKRSSSSKESKSCPNLNSIIIFLIGGSNIISYYLGDLIQ